MGMNEMKEALTHHELVVELEIRQFSFSSSSGSAYQTCSLYKGFGELLIRTETSTKPTLHYKQPNSDTDPITDSLRRFDTCGCSGSLDFVRKMVVHV